MRRTILSITALLLASCGSPAPQARPQAAQTPDAAQVIVCFGDSLTAGYGLSSDASYPALLQTALDAQFPGAYRVVNAGVSGDTTATALERVDWALEDEPSYAIVVLGANDGLRGIPVEETERALRAIVAQFQDAGATVLLGGMRLPPNYGLPFDAEFRAIYPRIAEETGASLIPFFLEGVAGVPALNQSDGIHPTEEGYARIVDEIVIPALLPMLEADPAR